MRQKNNLEHNMEKHSAGFTGILAAVFVLFVSFCLSGQAVSAFEYNEGYYDHENDDGYNNDYDDEYDSDYDDGENNEDNPENPDNPDDPELNPVTDLQFSLDKYIYEYTGKAIMPVVTVKGVDSSGQTVILKQDEDYTVQYEDHMSYGVGRVIVSGKGSYYGYHILKFAILPEKVSGVKVKSPFYMENTVTWNRAKGADGYYIYRKAPGSKEYSFVANVTDANFQVFHDKSKSLKKNKKYSYKVVSYVTDRFYDEEIDGEEYQRPNDTVDSWYDDYNSPYKNNTSYYSSYNNNYYNWYNYSAIKGRCVSSYEASRYGTASGKVTAKTSGRTAIYTGDANIDYMAYLTNKKIVKKGMGNDKRVKAIYNWMVKNCTFTKDVKDSNKLKKMKKYIKYTSSSVQKKAQAYEKKIMQQIYKGKALCIGTDWHDCDRAEVALAYRKGSCSYLSPMFNILCNQAGVEAYIVDGDYVNRDKSRDYHNWSFVKLGKKYYWYDVPVACKNKKVKDTWYKKGTKFWKTCHRWSSSATKGYQGAAFKK